MIMDELAEHEVVFSAIKSSEKRTNFERIKNMSVEEMAKAIVGIDEDYMCRVFCKNICKLRDNNCPVAVKNEDCPISITDCIFGWLQSEV